MLPIILPFLMHFDQLNAAYEHKWLCSEALHITLNSSVHTWNQAQWDNYFLEPNYCFSKTKWFNLCCRELCDLFLFEFFLGKIFKNVCTIQELILRQHTCIISLLKATWVIESCSEIRLNQIKLHQRELLCAFRESCSAMTSLPVPFKSSKVIYM